MKQIQGPRRSHFTNLEIKLKMSIETPTYKQFLIVLVLNQCQTVVLTTFQSKHLHPHFFPENVELSWLAELLLAQLFLVEVHHSMNIFLFLKNFQNSIDSQLQTVIVATTVNVPS